MASAGGHCNHINHVATQLPYALFVAVFCFIGYAIMGICNLAGVLSIAWIALPVCIVLMGATLLFIRKKEGMEKE